MTKQAKVQKHLEAEVIKQAEVAGRDIMSVLEANHREGWGPAEVVNYWALALGGAIGALILDLKPQIVGPMLQWILQTAVSPREDMQIAVKEFNDRESFEKIKAERGAK